MRSVIDRYSESCVQYICGNRQKYDGSHAERGKRSDSGDNMKKRNLRDIYFFTIVKITSIFIIIISLCTLIILTFNFFVTNVQYSVSQLQYILNHLNYYLVSSENFVRTFSANEMVQEYTLLYSRDPQKFSIANTDRMKQQIDSIIQSNDYIHSVNVYGMDGILLATNTNNFKHPPISEDTLDMQTSAWMPESILNYGTKENEHVLSLLRPFYAISNSVQIGYIEICIAEEAISDIFLSNQDENSHLFMMDRNNIIQSSTDKTELFQSFDPTYRVSLSPEYHITSSGIVIMKEVPEINWYIVSVTDYYSYFRPLCTLAVLTLVIMMVCILFSFKISRKMAQSVTTPIYQLIEHTKNIKTGTWETIAPEHLNNVDVELLYKEFNEMMAEKEQLKNNLLEEQKLKNKLSLNLLQEQINPHFLYNTLDNICSLAELGEQKKLIELVMNLSSFYRHVLSGGKSLITVAEELEICKSYLHIMQIRYYNKFDYQIICPDNLLHCSCIKLLLQPIIENSIYHGIKELSEKGLIRIEFTDLRDSIRITVQDNGLGLRSDYLCEGKKRTNFGIKNTNKRVKLYYGADYGLSLKSIEPHGCLATILIKKEELV